MKQHEEDTRFGRLMAKGVKIWTYLKEDVWSDTRESWMIDAIKIGNLSVKSFLSADLQTRACAMTYRTLLAIVPALALLFAIGRGFGFQDLLETQLITYFPAQHKALEESFKFVDSYLEHTSGGIFVGVGIVFLLWTLISLMSNVEQAFNTVWGVREGRSIWRKITDYLTILLVLPVLMICSSGIQIFMSSLFQAIFPSTFVTPLIEAVFDFLAYLFCCLFFAGSYMLIPNTKVKFLNALGAGFLAGTGFTIVQWLFVTGQIYVTKYNAIYGSFAFLPMLMIWLQLVWLITLIGALVCYASQSFFRFSFEKEINNISTAYASKVTIAILLIISRRFENRMAPLTPRQISDAYMLPPRVVTGACDRLFKAGMITRLITDSGSGDAPLQPSYEISHSRLSDIVHTLENQGDAEFIPGFSERFSSLDKLVLNSEIALESNFGDLKLTDIDFDITPAAETD